MRLFAGWNFLFSNSNEQAISQVGSWRQRDVWPLTKQVITQGSAGSASIGTFGTLTIGVTGQDITKNHLLDLSCNGNVYVNITQGGVARQLPMNGTLLLPARLTMSLSASVTALTVVSRESTNAALVEWVFAEYLDVTNSANFPVV